MTQRHNNGRFKKSRHISRTAPLIAFAGFLMGIAVTLSFVALGNAYPEKEIVEVDDGYTAWIQAPTPGSIVPCQEDEVIIGTGDFHSTGLWDAYACQPLDDLVEIHPIGQDLYTVEPGDTMWDLSQGAGISLTELEDLNGGSTSRDWGLIHPGEVLTLG